MPESSCSACKSPPTKLNPGEKVEMDAVDFKSPRTVYGIEGLQMDRPATGGYDRRRAPVTPSKSNKYRFKYHMVKRDLRDLRVLRSLH
jgi:hypothetical protein